MPGVLAPTQRATMPLGGREWKEAAGPGTHVCVRVCVCVCGAWRPTSSTLDELSSKPQATG